MAESFAYGNVNKLAAHIETLANLGEPRDKLIEYYRSLFKIQIRVGDLRAKRAGFDSVVDLADQAHETLNRLQQLHVDVEKERSILKRSLKNSRGVERATAMRDLDSLPY